MALSKALAEARRQAAPTIANRRRQTRAEARMDEQLLLEVARAQLTDEWDSADALGDAEFVRLARRLNKVLSTEEQRDLLAKLFAEWTRDEAAEERLIENARHTNSHTIETFRRNTPLFVGDEYENGAWVPGGAGSVA